MAERGPLGLYWYRKEQNFGDAIGPMIVAHVSGRKVVWAGHTTCDLYALGSLLGMVSKEQAAPRTDLPPPSVWGTGAMNTAVDGGFMRHVYVALLRGPVTAAFLRRSDRGYGDPGLLMADVMPGPDREDYVAVVPHMNYVDDRDIRAAVAADPRLRLVDVRDPDPLAVVRQIAGAAHVISQSLHGLIVADAYGVPNTWLDPMGMPGMGGLKFLDYGAGVNRAMGLPLEVDDIGRFAATAPTGLLSYRNGILASKAALYANFPRDLMAEAEL